MLKLSNIKIKYEDHIVVNSGEIELKPGDLCLVSGDSGTGKSSLLDILSVQGKGNHEFDYYWKNEDVNSFDENRKNSFLLNEVACVTQNNLIFGEFTVKENLESFSEIGYGNIRKDLIDILVNQLGLNKLLDKKAKKLSGGEKQRVAIACAVLKDADLYLFDEPTSMVDIDRKESIFNLLKELAAKGKIVVVVSHELDKAMFNKVFLLENSVIKQVKENEDVITYNSNHSHGDIKNIISKLSKKFFFSQPIVNALYVTIISICMALIINIIGGAYASVTEQKKLAEIVNNPELLVVNTDTMVFCEADEFGAHPISDEDFEAIKSIEGVVTARRFVYFPLEQGIREGVSDGNPVYPKNDDLIISLKKDGKIIGSFDYVNEYDNYYAIYPTYEHQNINANCLSLNEEGEGIYITQRIADKLGIDKLNGHVINLSFAVPVGNAPGFFNGNIAGMGEGIFLRRYMFSILINRDFPIKGIIKDIEYYSYMHTYKPDFFLDIDTIESIQHEYFEKYKNLLLTLSMTEMPWPDLREYYDTQIVDPGIWNSSAIVVHVSDNEKINQVISEITKINPILSVSVKSYGMVDIDTKMTSNVIKTARGYSLIILFVILVSISIIKGYRRKNRNDEYQLLRKNGFSYNAISQIEKKENYLEIVIILILSILMAILTSFILTKILYMNILLSVWMLLGLVVIVLCSVLIGNVISKLIVKNRC